MTFRSLAFNNVLGKWRSYAAFFLSSVFSVAIFYMYAAFLAHPDVASGEWPAAAKVRQGMEIGEYVIILFSFLFMLYSGSAFLRTRQKELGLFSLFGMTRSQLRRLLVYENAVIAVLSTISGIFLGILFSKLFFMSLAALLGMADSIAFAVPPLAVGLTAGAFFVLFSAITAWTALRVGKTEIVDMLQASRRPRDELVYSPRLVPLAIVCLSLAYAMAFALRPANLDFLVLPILLTVLLGTYLVFTQWTLWLLNVLQNRPNIRYRGTNLIVLARLGYAVRDNARMLFIVSVLSAVILTVSSAFYMLGYAAPDDAFKERAALMRFIGLFIGLLFFIASGSMIYFRLFTELPEDRAQFRALRRIGMTTHELRKIVVTETAFLFYVPCLAGIAHSLVAMKALDRLLQTSYWAHSFVVIGIYLALQTLYFIVTCRNYMKKIVPGEGEPHENTV